MKEPKLQRETRNIELVETGNLARSLNRLRNAPGDYFDRRWKQALYHAILIDGISPSICEAVRKALELP